MNDHSYHILIVEDDPLFASNIEMQVDQLGYALAGVADNSDDALRLMAGTIDLVLMDVNIKGSYDGIELTNMIKEQYDVPVLFITANHDDLTFNRASRSNPAGFILKPFTDLQLKRAIQLALQSASSNPSPKEEEDKIIGEDEVLFVRKNQQIHKVHMDTILYLEADGRYCRIHTEDQMYMVRKPMKELLEMMDRVDFQRSHRSYVVNMKKVSSVDLENDSLMLGSRMVPLSQRERERLLEKLNWI